MKKRIVLSMAASLMLVLAGCTDDGSTFGQQSSRTSANGTQHNGGNIAGGGNGENGHNGYIPGEDPVLPHNTAKIGGWYGRTIVSAKASDGKVYIHKTAGVFGQLIDSKSERDRHDISALGTAILQVVFPHGDWAEKSGDYFSNYQRYTKDGTTKKSWVFQVKNQRTVDLSDAPLTIKLDAIHKVTYKKVDGGITYYENGGEDKALLQKLTLIDVDNGKSYSVDELATANLTMGGKHTRTFKWVLGGVDASDFTVDSASITVKSDMKKSQDMTVDGFDRSTLAQQEQGGKFGLPPM